MTPAITIYHNPECGTSRSTLALIRSRGIEPHIIEYLNNPPGRAKLVELLTVSGHTPRQLVRQQNPLFDELKLHEPHWSDDQLIDFMVEHSQLMNRPIVVSPLGTRLCRPADTVHALLPPTHLADLTLPQIDLKQFDRPTATLRLNQAPHQTHAPRFLLLYGSLRERSYSKLLTLEAARLLQAMGGETRIFDPAGLPLPDSAPETHPKVQELRDAAMWAEGMVWTSPERHGAMTGILKTQIDWIPLSMGAVRPTQGKTLAVMQVSGGSQSFNAVNQLRVLGRWMRMLTIPNQSSVAKAFLEFDEAGRMKPSVYYDRVVDVMEELVKFTLLTRNVAPYLVDRYSERRESAQELSQRVNGTA